MVTIVSFFFPWAHKKNFDNHKSMLLAEAEADGDNGGWRNRVVSDVTCRALSGLVALGRAMMARRVVIWGDKSLLDPPSGRAGGAGSIWYTIQYVEEIFGVVRAQKEIT
jgi:hypothetical protein